MATNQTEAKDAYKRQTGEIRVEIQRLRQRLREHKERAKREATNWAFAGDLAHVLVTLRDVSEFLQGK